MAEPQENWDKAQKDEAQLERTHALPVQVFGQAFPLIQIMLGASLSMRRFVHLHWETSESLCLLAFQSDICQF